MKSKKSTELNDKIAQIIEASGMSSSIFADYIGLPRPIMSHIVAKRNKATLEIVQKIIRKFPVLGMDWTFDGTELSPELLIEIAYTDKEGLESFEDNAEVSNSRPKAILKMVVFHPDKSYTDYYPCSSQPSSEIPSPNILANSEIEKIVLFFSDNSFADFKPA